MKVTLKDGSCKEYAEAMPIIDIAKDISEGLARVACAAELDYLLLQAVRNKEPECDSRRCI